MKDILIFLEKNWMALMSALHIPIVKKYLISEDKRPE
jgi:hypothetical protein